MKEAQAAGLRDTLAIPFISAAVGAALQKSQKKMRNNPF